MTKIIYCFTFPNGKKYIGKTEVSLKRRLISHRHEANREESTRNSYLYNAVRKYGWENILIEVMEEHDDTDALNEAEVRLIEENKTTDRQFGYNLREGGEGGSHSEDVKKRIGDANRGEKNGMYGKAAWNRGKKLSKEHIENLRKSHLGQKAWNKGMKGQYSTGPRSEEAKQKISAANKGSGNGQAKLTWEIVRQMRAEYASGEFLQKELAEKYNIGSGHISVILNNKAWREECA
jgi:group I intron endonuclease